MAFWSRPAVGLDIGSRMVKAVQLKKSGKKVELDKFGIADIYPNGDKPPTPEAQRKCLLEAIKRCLHEAGITDTQTCTAVAGESIIVRYIQMPDMPEEELKDALHWQAEEYIPFRVEDVNIDSTIIGRSENKENPQLDVLLVCARKDLIASHVQLLEEAGLTPSVIDVDSFAFLNSFDMNYRPDPSDIVGLVNIGGDITSISVYAGGMPRFSRDISIGGSNVTTAIQQKLDISMAEAEALKLKLGAHGNGGKEIGGDTDVDIHAEGEQSTVMESPDEGGPESLAETIRSTVQSMEQQSAAAGQDDNSPEAIAARTIKNTLGNLVGEIRRSIQFYENQSRTHKVQRLVIGGGGVAMGEFDQYLQNEIKLPVEVIDPLKRIPVTGKGINADLLRDNRHMLSVGVGLALRKVVD